MATVGVGRYLKITVANGAMDVAVSCAKDDITALLAVVLATVSKEELKLVSGSCLGAIVEMGAYFQRIWRGTRRHIEIEINIYFTASSPPPRRTYT